MVPFWPSKNLLKKASRPLVKLEGYAHGDFRHLALSFEESFRAIGKMLSPYDRLDIV